jgi:isoquinoline 1-oxidoreductase beta subunit
MNSQSELSRRTVLKLAGGAGAVFSLGSFSSLACTPVKTGVAEEKTKKAALFVPNAFMNIAQDGTLTVAICHSDMGQGVRTSLAMLLAEELDADWHKVKVEQAGAGDNSPGGLGTGGSSTIRTMNRQMREMGASARLMLITAAAKTWNVDPATCKTEKGTVVNTANGKSIPYGDLVGAASAVAVPNGQSVQLKAATDYKIVGKPTPRVDNPAVVTGAAMYGCDVRVDGMKYAVLLRPEAFGASVGTVDDSAARQIPGVKDVVKVSNGVAVIADNTWAAIKGRDALKVTWNPGPNVAITTATLLEGLKKNVVDHKTMPEGARVVEATYQFPYLAHATMEPLNAVADVKEGSCTVWTGTQGPDGAQQQAARILGIPAENVKVNVMLLGGGFGRRSGADFVADAVEASKAAKAPVKVIWTREDDTKHDYYRPMSYHSMKGAVGADGAPVGWSHQEMQAGAKPSTDFGGAGIPYSIPNAGFLRSGAPSPIPNGAWRSVEHTQISVANECFIDEMAHAAGKDPFEFRRGLIKDERLKKVLETAAEKSNWSQPLAAGSGRGIACFSGYGSYVAHVIEVTVKGNAIKVDKVYAAIDCGQAVNPKGVEAQIQGACCDGLSTALRAEITIDKGGVVQNSWYDYKWITMEAVPPIDITHIQGSGDFGGMGETGYPSVPAAVANAVFAATGKRMRKFPIKVDELV